MSKIFVDRNKTRTAAEIHSVAECQSLIQRHRRSLTRMLNEGGGRPTAPRRVTDAMRYTRCALSDLNQRLDELQS